MCYQSHNLSIFHHPCNKILLTQLCSSMSATFSLRSWAPLDQILYRHTVVCGKVMFCLSVCLSTRGSPCDVIGLMGPTFPSPQTCSKLFASGLPRPIQTCSHRNSSGLGPWDLFKLVHLGTPRPVGKRAIGLRLKVLLVTRLFVLLQSIC